MSTNLDVGNLYSRFISPLLLLELFVIERVERAVTLPWHVFGNSFVSIRRRDIVYCSKMERKRSFDSQSFCRGCCQFCVNLDKTDGKEGALSTCFQERNRERSLFGLFSRRRQRSRLAVHSGVVLVQSWDRTFDSFCVATYGHAQCSRRGELSAQSLHHCVCSYLIIQNGPWLVS